MRCGWYGSRQVGSNSAGEYARSFVPSVCAATSLRSTAMSMKSAASGRVDGRRGTLNSSIRSSSMPVIMADHGSGRSGRARHRLTRQQASIPAGGAASGTVVAGIVRQLAEGAMRCT